MYDIIIIGGGTAGISASLYAVSRGKNTLVLEKEGLGGLIRNVSTVTHYTSILKGETGESFANRLRQQVEDAGVNVRYESVEKVVLAGDEKVVKTDKATYTAKKIIIAGGTTPNHLDVPGANLLRGKGMEMNAAKHGEQYRHKHVYVIGGADGAVKEAIYLSGIASKVTIVHFEDTLGAIAEFTKKVDAISNIEVLLHHRLHAIHGETQVEGLSLMDDHSGTVKTYEDPGCGIFVYTGSQPNTSLYTELALENGYIPVNEKMETTIASVYAVGDIRVKQVRQIATAVSDGAIAAVNASSDI